MTAADVSRRSFLQSTLSAAALVAARPTFGAPGANDRIRVGVIGAFAIWSRRK